MNEVYFYDTSPSQPFKIRDEQHAPKEHWLLSGVASDAAHKGDGVPDLLSSLESCLAARIVQSPHLDRRDYRKNVWDDNTHILVSMVRYSLLMF